MSERPSRDPLADDGLYFRQLLAGRQVAQTHPVAGQMANFMSLVGDPAKRELMKVIRKAAWIDTMGDEKESNVLIVAARLLGLDPREWAQL